MKIGICIPYVIDSSAFPDTEGGKKAFFEKAIFIPLSHANRPEKAFAYLPHRGQKSAANTNT